MSEGATHGHAQSRDVHEVTTAHPGGSANRISIHIDATALSVIALMFSVAAIVLAIALAFLQPQSVDEKIATAAAETSEAMAERVATANATAQAGKEHARIALAEVQRANAQLEAKGLVSSSQH